MLSLMLLTEDESNNIDDVAAYIVDVAAYADDGCYYCCCFPMQSVDSYIYI